MLLSECFFVLWTSGDWNRTQAVAPENVPVPSPVGVLVSLIKDYSFDSTCSIRLKEKSAESAVPAKIKSIKSVKHVLYLRVPWFHASMLIQKICKARQR